MHRSRFAAIVSGATLSAVAVMAGCSTASLPSLSEIGDALKPLPVVGPPTDIYARLARGALSCWFGQSGPLKKGYVYHAEAAPPSKGGKAMIVIHERDPTSTNPRGLRAYRIVIVPDGEASALTVENLALPAPLAQSMERDVHRWAAGSLGCSDSEDEGWKPEPQQRREDGGKLPEPPKPPAKTGRSA
jgi:hypothetical protein